ncbi:hypothetical protein B0H11DRAFT_1993484 [Mycena galericulata]|nr:hypothetical protein B0H11DRAFT_1993484 [Mycena galericulata]
MEALPGADDVFRTDGEKILLEEETLLPFTAHSPCEAYPDSSLPSRGLDTINNVAAEVWKALRMTKTKKKSGPQDLSIFPGMHLDIMLEVLCHLHPLDLEHVSRTNKAFRGLLHSPVADSTWRMSFALNEELPTAPLQIPARCWARLLFGPQICDECGAPNTLPDYIIWRRLCTACMGQKLSATVPGYDESDEVNTLVPRTMRDDGTRSYDGVTQPQGRFWSSEGIATAEIYERYKSDDDPKVLRRFIQSRHLLVEDIQTIGNRSSQWAENLWAEAESRSYERRCRLAERAVKRLISEGWEMVDINHVYIIGCEHLERIRRLTSKSWNKIRPYIVAMVAEARGERHAEFVQGRKAVLTIAAMSTLRAPVPGLKHACYPPPHAIYSFPPLEQLLNDPSFEPLDPEDPRLHAALIEAEAFVDSWCAENRALLTSLLPHSGLNSSYSPDPEALARATSIFRCPARVGTGIAIGWEEARTHLNWFRGRPPNDTRTVEFCERGSAAARTLATLLDRDPATVTAAAMDEANARFVCGQCPPGRDALRWRECVLHDVEKNDRNLASHVEPCWLLLSPLATLDVHRREGQDKYSALPTWSCTLCDAHFPQCTAHTIALQHARSDHEIESPIEGVHIIHFLFPDRPRRRRAVITEGFNPACYRCTRCAKDYPGVVKLLTLHGMKRHIADKHLIDSTVYGDWTKVQRTIAFE